MTPNQAAVFRVIEETIAAKQIMPTAPRIATISGVKITSVNSALYQLQDAGVIDIANYGSGKRVITVMATGEHTAHPDDARRVRAADVPNDSFRAIVPEPVVPCWKCGVRSDIGCAHMRPSVGRGETITIGDAANRVLDRLAGAV